MKSRAFRHNAILRAVQTHSNTTPDEGGDEHWASVVLLAGNDNAADASTTFDDQSESNHTLTATGQVQYDDAQAPDGMTTSMLFDGTGDYLTAASHADFVYGTGDLTVEMVARLDTLAVARVLFDQRIAGNTEVCPGVYVTTTGALVYEVSGTARITSAGGVIVADTTHHVALCRASGVSKLFVDGGQVGSSFTDGFDLTTSQFRIGANFGGNSPMLGWISNVRVTKGVARYTDTFTPPELPMLSS